MVERIKLVELTKWMDGYICFKWREFCFYSFVGLSGLNLFIRLSGFASVELIKLVEMVGGVGWIGFVQLVGLV